MDILLTHDAPLGIFPGRGSPDITEILKRCRPDFHFFGHVEPKDSQHCYTAQNLPTECWIFEDLSFGRKMNGNLEGAMGILDWSGTWEGTWTEGGEVQVVNDKWLFSMRARTWEGVLPEMD